MLGLILCKRNTDHLNRFLKYMFTATMPVHPTNVSVCTYVEQLLPHCHSHLAIHDSISFNPSHNLHPVSIGYLLFFPSIRNTALSKLYIIQFRNLYFYTILNLVKFILTSWHKWEAANYGQISSHNLLFDAG